VEFAVKEGVVVFPGALTPTEVIAAWKAASDFVKVFPCAQLGGDSYIRALKAALPQVPLIAAGGVNQLTARNFILAGASALGVGGELIPKDAIQQRRPEWIRELAQRFLGYEDRSQSNRSLEGKRGHPEVTRKGGVKTPPFPPPSAAQRTSRGV
jgi:2-dehydro-3-deoxyphosphogluconate aldolase/(4S)-4-hydroxy-2-oxoglutarate aldolase